MSKHLPDPSVAASPQPPAPVWADPVRAGAFHVWLAREAPMHGLVPDTVRVASADASFRRYFRVDRVGGAGSCIIMDAPPAQEDCTPFVHVGRLMEAAGLKVPRILAWDEPQGFMLLSDLGTQTMMDVIDPDRPEANAPWYAQATDALIAWQRASRPGVLPPYDEALLRRELALFPDWYLTQHKGVALEGKQRETLDKAFDLIVARNLAAPKVFVHRDFMPRNLMIPAVPGQTPATRLGVLDFQDAVYGPVTYDIASLMRDAFLSWEEDFVLDITIRYWQQARKAGLPVGDDFGEFYRGVEWMGLQRHLKVLGIFCRLKHRDGKPKYSQDLPRFFAYAHKVATRYNGLGPLARLLEPLMGTSRIDAFY